MNALVKLVSAVYEADAENSRAMLQLWPESAFHRRVDSTTREKLMRCRVLEFPVTTESLEIAKSVRLEGFYTAATKLCDMARRVEKIRHSPYKRQLKR